MNIYLKLAIFAFIITLISYSIHFIKNKKVRLVAKIVWVTLLVLFLLLYLVGTWEPVGWNLKIVT